MSGVNFTYQNKINGRIFDDKIILTYKEDLDDRIILKKDSTRIRIFLSNLTDVDLVELSLNDFKDYFEESDAGLVVAAIVLLCYGIDLDLYSVFYRYRVLHAIAELRFLSDLGPNEDPPALLPAKLFGSATISFSYGTKANGYIKGQAFDILEGTCHLMVSTNAGDGRYLINDIDQSLRGRDPYMGSDSRCYQTLSRLSPYVTRTVSHCLKVCEFLINGKVPRWYEVIKWNRIYSGLKEFKITSIKF